MSNQELLDLAIKTDEHILLSGPPGTGKSHFATDAAKKSGSGFYRTMQATSRSSAFELLGGFLPNPQGGMDYIPGPLVECWLEGGTLIIDEVSHLTGSDAESVLYKGLDHPHVAKLTLPTREVITPKPGFRVIATMNDAFEDLKPAILDRFGVRIKMDNISQGLREALGKLGNMVVRMYRQSGPEGPKPTAREVLRFYKLVTESGFSSDQAARLVFLSDQMTTARVLMGEMNES